MEMVKWKGNKMDIKQNGARLKVDQSFIAHVHSNSIIGIHAAVTDGERSLIKSLRVAFSEDLILFKVLYSQER